MQVKVESDGLLFESGLANYVRGELRERLGTSRVQDAEATLTVHERTGSAGAVEKLCNLELRLGSERLLGASCDTDLLDAVDGALDVALAPLRRKAFPAGGATIGRAV